MWATEEGTKKFFHKVSIDPSKERNFDGLSVSALGAGTYLGSADEATDSLYEQVLLRAVQGGINFFDTAINYRGMRSERVIGKVVKELASRGIEREQLVIATKGGFLPYEGSRDLFEDYVRIHYLDTHLIQPNEIVAECHCMSPPFLENQIFKSLENLGLETIDLYYLHNPETQLSEVGEEEFYKRLTAAFSLFEKKVAEDKIRRYGIATWNGFRQKGGKMQLARVLQCAQEAGGEKHHFRAIELPYNLVMLEAAKSENQIVGKEKVTILEAAHRLQTSTMISAPLMQSQVGQLSTRVFERLPTARTAMLQALQFVLSTPYVTSAFVGMKQLAHWEENREALFTPLWSEADWKRVAEG